MNMKNEQVANIHQPARHHVSHSPGTLRHEEEENEYWEKSGRRGLDGPTANLVLICQFRDHHNGIRARKTYNRASSLEPQFAVGKELSTFQPNNDMAVSGITSLPPETITWWSVRSFPKDHLLRKQTTKYNIFVTQIPPEYGARPGSGTLSLGLPPVMASQPKEAARKFPAPTRTCRA